MPKQLQTALEARRWMVANSLYRITDKYGKVHYWWDDFECRFFSESEAVIITDVFAPFTIIDEPERKTFTRQQIASMSVKEFAANEAAIEDAIKAGRLLDEVQTDPQEGTLYHPNWAGGKPVSPLTKAITEKAREATAEAAERFEAAKKQPEWVRVEIDPAIGAGHTVQSLTHEIYSSDRMALRYICQHAQQVRITWPEWKQKGPTPPITSPRKQKNLMTISFALQIGAIVEYLPKEGE